MFRSCIPRISKVSSILLSFTGGSLLRLKAQNAHYMVSYSMFTGNYISTPSTSSLLLSSPSSSSLSSSSSFFLLFFFFSFSSSSSSS